MTIHQRIFFTLTILSLTLVSCDKLPSDSTLDGHWQLMTMSRGDTTISMKDSQAYWSFRLNLLELSRINKIKYFAHIVHRNDSLLIYDFCEDSENAVATDNNEWVKPEESALLFPWGIYAQSDNLRPGRVSVGYKIVSSGNSLVLTNDDTRLTLRKF